MRTTKKGRLASLLVAATFTASGGIALAEHDDVIPAEMSHGETISALAHETESGPGKGAIISAAASVHGKAASEAAKQKHADEDTEIDSDSDTDTDTDEVRTTGRPGGAGATGPETAAAAKADGRAFGQATAEAARPATAGAKRR
jgi:hypothetical protein